MGHEAASAGALGLSGVSFDGRDMTGMSFRSSEPAPGRSRGPRFIDPKSVVDTARRHNSLGEQCSEMISLVAKIQITALPRLLIFDVLAARLRPHADHRRHLGGVKTRARCGVYRRRLT